MSKLTESARNQECQIRIPGICNFDNTTTVLAHLPGGGMAGKVLDIHGAYACSACHDVVDLRNRTCPDRYSSAEYALQIQIWFFEGVIRTQILMIEAGLIKH